MNRYLLFLLLLLITVAAGGQKVSPDKYWVQLKDKQGTLYVVDAPREFLSDRALERRIKSGIEITEEDLPVSEIYLDSIRNLGIEIIGTSKWLNSVIIQTRDSLLLNKLSAFSFVDNFRPDYDNLSSGGAEWAGQNYAESNEDLESYYYGEASRQINMLGGNFLHNYGYKGNGIQIAVFDAGFYRVNEIKAFDHLWENNRLLSTRDFVDRDSEFFTHSTHGLAVLSTISAFLPDTFVGTAPEASVVLLRSEDATSETKIEEVNWLLAAEYADSAGVDIITSSLGYYNFPGFQEMNYDFDDLTGDRALVTRAAEKAFSKGMIVISSAGNEGNNQIWQKITPPADGLNVIAVGSVDTAYQVTDFSSRGNTTDGRIKPDVMAVGYRTRIIGAGGNPSNGYGTSYAAPQVAGLIACLWQSVPEKTNKEIIEAVRRSSDQYSSPDSIRGYGIPNFIHALWELKSNGMDSFEQEFIIYPNPFVSEFEIQPINPEIEIDQIDIFSSSGKLLHSYGKEWKPGETIRINSLQNESPGVYYLIGKSTGAEIVTKLIKQ